MSSARRPEAVRSRRRQGLTALNTWIEPILIHIVFILYIYIWILDSIWIRYDFYMISMWILCEIYGIWGILEAFRCFLMASGLRRSLPKTSMAVRFTLSCTSSKARRVASAKIFSWSLHLKAKDDENNSKHLKTRQKSFRNPLWKSTWKLILLSRMRR